MWSFPPPVCWSEHEARSVYPGWSPVVWLGEGSALQTPALTHLTQTEHGHTPLAPQIESGLREKKKKLKEMAG